MANAAAFIDEGLWRKNRDFQKLSRYAQCTFCQVLSQKDLDTAGVLTLHLDLLAKACHELTVEQIMADFDELEAMRFLFVDYETDELLIRSYVRRVSSRPRSNAWLSVAKNAKMIASEKLRRELAVELRGLRRKDATQIADEIDPNLTPLEPPPVPSDPLGTPSRKQTPSEPSPDPHRQVQVLVPVSPSVVGYVGERRPECSKHDENSEENCRACMRRREWDENHEAEEDELEAKRRKRLADAEAEAQRNCLHCDDAGWLKAEDGELVEPAMKCQIHLENLEQRHA